MKTNESNTILVVDDNPRLLSGARLTLEMNGYDVVTASNGNQAIQFLEERQPNLIISDILMPECNGFDFLEKVHARPEWLKIPFLFLTALQDEESLGKARVLGADEYLTKPFSSKNLLQSVRSRLNRAEDLQKTYTMETYLDTVEIMAKAVESRDAYTGGHVNRVTAYAQALARELGWSNEEIAQVRLAGILHDIGKVIVPDAVLNKPGRLTPAEWAVMKQHPVEGDNILTPLHSLSIVREGVLYHHERYDGKGYPDGLAGKEIPAIGRLMAVVDTFDAMTSSRSYRAGLDPQIAIEELQNCSNMQFDPEIVLAFVNLWFSEDQQIQSIYEKEVGNE